MSVRIGFIGLGHMGKPMAMNLAKKGFRLTVFDSVPERSDELRTTGASVADSVAALAASSDIVITMLPNSAIVREVVLGINGLIGSLLPDSILIDMSTSDPSVTRHIARALAAKGVKVLDAPVAKGIPAATDGTLTIMVGGERADFDFCRDILAAMGTQIFYCGQLGAGHIVKIINNLLVGVLVPICAESLALGVKAGVDPEILMDVITAGSGNSFVLDKLIRKHVLGDDYEGVFSVDYMLKDMRLATNLAKEHHVPLLFGDMAHSLYESAHNDGNQNACYLIVAKIIERLAKVNIAASQAQIGA